MFYRTRHETTVTKMTYGTMVIKGEVVIIKGKVSIGLKVSSYIVIKLYERSRFWACMYL